MKFTSFGILIDAIFSNKELLCPLIDFIMLERIKIYEKGEQILHCIDTDIYINAALSSTFDSLLPGLHSSYTTK